MSNGFIITGTGTDIGKTLVTAALCHQLRSQGKPARAIKPVHSGWDETAMMESDCGVLLQAMGQPVTEEGCAAMSPWRFRAVLAADMAARRENARVSAREVSAFCRQALSQEGIVLAEGSGGLMTPLNEGETMLDWFADLQWPVLLVAGSYLGTLSHTLTSLECLKARGVALAGVVISTSESEPIPSEETAARIAKALDGTAPVTVLPRLSGGTPWTVAPDLTGLLGRDSSNQRSAYA